MRTSGNNNRRRSNDCALRATAAAFEMTLSDNHLLRFRSSFPILETSTYLVSNSLGAMPSGAADQLDEYGKEWASRGVRAWADGWWELPAKMGNEIAPLIGAGDDEVVMVPTVTLAMTSILASLDYPENRNEIVMTELDFPSVRYAYDALAPRLGAVVKVVPTEDGMTVDIERLVESITPRTRLVAISHVLFRSAYIQDAALICKRAHEVGALVALDAYHSVGIMPVDVRAIGADFLCGGVLKWLCGGPGSCFIYAAPSVRELAKPAITGWQAHQRPFAFASEMEYAPGAWKWLGGTPVVPALYAGRVGPAIIRQAGIDSIRGKSVRQTQRLLDAADERGWVTHTPRDAERRGGTVAVDVPNAAHVARALLAEDIVIDFRPGAGIRIAPHFYTTDDEIDKCISTIDEILRTGSWKSYVGVSTVVT